MKHKVADLEGWLLDLAVAIADGRDWTINRSPHADGGVIWITVVDTEMADQPQVPYAPSRSGCDASPIIDRERITLIPESPKTFWNSSDERRANSWHATLGKVGIAGPTHLVAAMRAFVINKLGEEIELP